jgi:hypothetical protein
MIIESGKALMLVRLIATLAFAEARIVEPDDAG